MTRLEKFLKKKSSSYILPAVATVILLIVWELAVKIFSIPQFILPAPSAIVASWASWSGAVVENALFTLKTTMIGFLLALIAGLLLGFLIGYSKFAYATLYPLLVGFNTIPKVALVPLLAIWFGIGAVPAVITAFLLAFFTIAVNVSLGLATVEPEMRDVLNALGATKVEVFEKVGFPHSLPYLFASLKIAISQAFVGSVISETVASNKGLGYLIVSASSNFDIPLAFLCLLVLAVMGMILYGIFVFLEKKMVYWVR